MNEELKIIRITCWAVWSVVVSVTLMACIAENPRIVNIVNGIGITAGSIKLGAELVSKEKPSTIWSNMMIVWCFFFLCVAYIMF